MEANPPQPAPTALTAPEDTIAVHPPFSAPSLATMRVEIEALLDDGTRKEFANTVALIVKLGNKKPKFLEPRRRKIRDIVEKNTQIVVLYNEYAKAHSQKEKRLTYRLPVFQELEAQVRAAEAPMRQMEETEIEHQENGDVDMEDAADVDAQFEQQEDEILALEIAETREETEQTNLAKDTEAADEREDADVTITEHYIDEATNVLDEFMEMVAAEKVMPEPAATIATDDAQQEDAGMTAARSEVPEPTVTIAGDDQDVQFEEGVATEVEHYSGQGTRQRVVPYDASPAVVEQASVTSATLDEHKPVDIPMKSKTRSQPDGPQAANGTAPEAVSGEAIITAQSLAQPTHKPNEQIIPIVNPEAFPINRIQDIQALRYPLARITGVWAHRKTCGDVVQVTIDMQDGPVDHFIINDARLITAFGLREGNDFITVHEPYLRHMETFNIRIFPNQRVCNMKAFVVGEMISARHAYLYWLEFRGSADPKGEPWVQEARRIATQIGRRALDVWKEIDGYWQLEHGSGGRMYREIRMKYLGEDPVIHESDLHEKKMTMSVWG